MNAALKLELPVLFGDSDQDRPVIAPGGDRSNRE